MNKQNSIGLFLFLAFSLLLAGCSVHSGQLDGVRQLMSGDEADLLKDAEWQANWDGNQYTLYAVNAGAETIFAFDNRLLVRFDGWNITQVVGVLESVGPIRIEQQNSEWLFFENERLLSRDRCSDWLKQQDVANGVEYRQECSRQNTSVTYSNSIRINAAGFITRLAFSVHPEYPSLIMESVSKSIK